MKTPAPAASPRRKPPPRDNGYRYKSQYAVVVLCDDEEQHRAAFDSLKAAGYRCRLVCV